ncbi:MAG: SDR family NAD(P)-dependent oxidoreductase [Legionellaceae bacterium]|nr:SDR family NAD(P)-dependent oxidoreductase [Legionellaceae bacterium]
MYIVTGGGSGLGRALACALASRGQLVLIVGRSEKALIKTASFSSNIQYLCADVTSTGDRERLVAYLSTTPRIQGLIHNAGIIDPIVPITELSNEAWRACMATNLDAPLFLNQMLYDKLLNGRVLNIGSGAAHFPIMGWAAYCVSKAALAMLTRCWQLESNSVAFASVMPGIVDTQMQAQIRKACHMNAEKLEFFKHLKEADQLLSPETVALFLCWLLLDIDTARFVSQEWDIYDKTHHVDWLSAPHVVPEFE